MSVLQWASLQVEQMVWSLLALTVGLAHADKGSWQRVLDTYRGDDGRMDYALIKRDDAVAPTMEWLATAEVPSDRDAKVAFWINAYNAVTVDLVASNMPLKSIRDLDEGQVWKTRSFPVGGATLTLDQIEHEILIPLGEPRVHFALNCAAMSCPPLRAQVYSGEGLSEQLDAASKSWIRATGVRVNRASKTLHLSRIFDWYAEDFLAVTGAPVPGIEPRLQGVLRYVSQHVVDADREWLKAGGYAVSFSAYDWEINAKSP